jgi:hypothetical protein
LAEIEMTILNLNGLHFGRLLVISLAESASRRSMWNCKCDCGNLKVACGSLLRAGKVKSCGCLSAEAKVRQKTHGMTGTRVYAIWCGMISRCRLQNRTGSKNYSLKGISVCQRWLEFENFFEDMGDVPSGMHSIERNDSDGNYELGNCKWATPREQRHNTRDAIHVTYNGESKPLSVLAEQHGVKYHTAYSRMRKGLSLDLVLSPGSLRT